MTRFLHWAGIVAVAFLGGKHAVLVTNLWLFPTLTNPPGRRQPLQDNDSAVNEPITMLVPARNEAQRLPDSLPGLLAAGASTVIFLDDQSTDGTREVIESAATATSGPAPQVRVVTGSTRPAGWVGKTWPCEQLAALSDDDLLVFCDADVELAPGALPIVIAEMRRQDADVFSVICRQRAVSWGERLLTPLITDVILCLFPFVLLRAPAPSAATAEGMLLLFRRSAYDRLGGFAAVRDEIVEDVAIARLTRRRGLQLGLVLGGDQVQCRMYTGYREVITGMGRGLAPVVGGRRWVVAPVGCCTCSLTRRPSCCCHTPRCGDGLPCWASRSDCWSRPRPAVATGPRHWRSACHPSRPLPVVARAMRRTHSWKGRQYG